MEELLTGDRDCAEGSCVVSVRYGVTCTELSVRSGRSLTVVAVAPAGRRQAGFGLLHAREP